MKAYDYEQHSVSNNLNGALRIKDTLMSNEKGFSCEGCRVITALSLVQVSGLPSRGFQWDILLCSWPAVRQNIHVTPNTRGPTNFSPVTSEVFLTRCSWAGAQSWQRACLSAPPLARLQLLFRVSSYLAKTALTEHRRSVVQPHQLTKMLANYRRLVVKLTPAGSLTLKTVLSKLKQHSVAQCLSNINATCCS